MKFLRTLGLSGLMLSTTLFAASPIPGWYISLMGTGSYMPSLDFTLSPGAASGMNILLVNLIKEYVPVSILPPLNFTRKIEITYKGGGGGAGLVGFRNGNYRLEGELMYIINQYSSLQAGNVVFKSHQTPFPAGFSRSPFGKSMSGHTSLTSLLINGYYDFFNEQSDSNFVPYLGLGVGYSQVENELNLYIMNNLNETKINLYSKREKSGAFIGQLIAGAGYLFDDYLGIGLDYRYLRTGKISSLASNIQAHTLNFNMSVFFDC